MSKQTTYSRQEITSLLRAWKDGDEAAFGALIPVVFEDLRRLAKLYFRREVRESTLQPTAVVHEVYLRLLHQPITELTSRDHFFAIAGRLIRQVLVDHARSRSSLKRGGDCQKVPLTEAFGMCSRSPTVETLLQVHRALEGLGQLDARKARLVELRYFCGLTIPEAAEILGISRASAERDWTFAKRWLAHEISGVSVAPPAADRELAGAPSPRGRAKPADRSAA